MDVTSPPVRRCTEPAVTGWLPGRCITVDLLRKPWRRLRRQLGRKPGRAELLIAAGAILGLVALFLAFTGGGDGADPVANGPVAKAGTGHGADTGNRSDHSRKRGPKSPTAKKADPLAGPKGLPPVGGQFGHGFPGLPGGSLSASLPAIHITLSLDSAAPIGGLGYQVPTSRDNPQGIVHGVGNHWSMTTTGYGRPDYARIFFTAGPSGTPITCTIRINGRVTEHRSTKGPYGQMMCQG